MLPQVSMAVNVPLTPEAKGEAKVQLSQLASVA
jgi:hypothetical protein